MRVLLLFYKQLSSAADPEHLHGSSKFMVRGEFDGVTKRPSGQRQQALQNKNFMLLFVKIIKGCRR